MIGSEVQKAIYEALTSDPAVAGGKTFDRVPSDNPFPRITIGDEQVVDAGNTCGEGWEVFSDIHVWSRKVGKVETKQIMAAIVPRILAITVIVGFRLVACELDASRVFTEPDGLTTHGVLTFRFVIDPA